MMANSTGPAGKTIFVAGTDTSVGKTLVCGLLLQYAGKRLRTGYQKWVSTGGSGVSEDWRFCRETAGLPLDEGRLDLEVPFRFAYPASPHLAAELEGRVVDEAVIVARYHELAAAHELLIVEGVGGLMVPLRRDLLLADLLARLALPTLVVARSGLGTLNHTLLTLEALRVRQIPVVGVVCSDGLGEPGDDTLIADNLRTIGELGRCPVFGRLRRCSTVAEAISSFAPMGKAILAAQAGHSGLRSL
ncbi:MAG: dethiobiotin synthase [Desulfobulbaceae bacterium]|nr:dethiobiotin synthase [Desulfobulbaceae bacterium]